jgi:hypothetical protein
MELVKYRDAGLPTYTYFWVTPENRVVGPYFNSEQEARDWLAQNSANEDIVVRSK